MSKREGPDTGPEPKRARTNETVEIPKRTLAAILPYISAPDYLWDDLYTALPQDTLKELLPQVDINHYARRTFEKDRRLAAESVLENLAPTNLSLSEDLKTLTVHLGEGFRNAFETPLNKTIVLERMEQTKDMYMEDSYTNWREREDMRNILFGTEVDTNLLETFKETLQFVKSYNKKVPVDFSDERDDVLVFRFKELTLFQHNERIMITMDDHNDGLSVSQELTNDADAIYERLKSYFDAETRFEYVMREGALKNDYLVVKFDKHSLFSQQFDPPLDEIKIPMIEFEEEGDWDPNIFALFNAEFKSRINTEFWSSGQYVQLDEWKAEWKDGAVFFSYEYDTIIFTNEMISARLRLRKPIHGDGIRMDMPMALWRYNPSLFTIQLTDVVGTTYNPDSGKGDRVPALNVKSAYDSAIYVLTDYEKGEYYTFSLFSSSRVSWSKKKMTSFRAFVDKINSAFGSPKLAFQFIDGVMKVDQPHISMVIQGKINKGERWNWWTVKKNTLTIFVRPRGKYSFAPTMNNPNETIEEIQQVVSDWETRMQSQERFDSRVISYPMQPDYPAPAPPLSREIGLRALWQYAKDDPEEVVNAAASRRQDLLGM